MLVDYDTYKSQEFTCRNCGWHGAGSELNHGDYSEDCIGDLECPKCFELVAFWQAPLIDKAQDKP